MQTYLSIFVKRIFTEAKRYGSTKCFRSRHSETLKSKGVYAALYDLHSEKVDNIASQGMQQVSKKKKKRGTVGTPVD